MIKHPYLSMPDSSFWKRSVTELNYDEVIPLIGEAPFQLNQQTKIVTAGSCFAQNISRYLIQNQFNYLVTEPPAPRLHPKVIKEFNYGTFSARYGNIYNAKQLLQLFDRAYRHFEPIETMWIAGTHQFIDPFRPNIQPQGFYTQLEFNIDRNQHLRAVRNLFENLDVFIFTLGMTEHWAHSDDGAVFPLCPGVAGGKFDPQKHVFKNSRLIDILQDLEQFYKNLKLLNPQAKMILTVSPVPLIATASNNHILSATTYSKSVLRVAAEELSQNYADISYFPAYEIIASHFNCGQYFAEDLRTITEKGIDHVMRVFFKYYTGTEISNPVFINQVTKNSHLQIDAIVLAEMQVQCDEVMLEN